MIRSLPSAALKRASIQCRASPPSQLTQWLSTARRPATRSLPKLTLTVHSARSMALVQHFSTNKAAAQDNLGSKINAALEKQGLPKVSSEVSSTSTTTKALDVSSEEQDVEMMAGIKSDMKTIRETFNLSSVPKEAYNIGLAGVLPYLGTSISTFYLAWDINYAHVHGAGFLLSGEAAEKLLHLIEPIQVGYGAVIISFLGAIHWGLEWAGYGGKHGYSRYAYGVIAPAVAWPTIFLPVEYALITQFLAFTFLYGADANATRKGWCPPWYATYRFVLTFFVGASIVLSLIGRGNVTGLIGTASGPAQKVQAVFEDTDWELLESEERARRAEAAAKAEEEEGEEDEEKSEDEEEEKSEE